MAIHLQGLSNGSNYCYYITALQTLASNPSVQGWIADHAAENNQLLEKIIQDLEQLRAIEPRHELIKNFGFLLPPLNNKPGLNGLNYKNQTSKNEYEDNNFLIIGLKAFINFIMWLIGYSVTDKELQNKNQLELVKAETHNNPILEEEKPVIKSVNDICSDLEKNLRNIEKILVIKTLGSLISLNTERLSEEDRNFLKKDLIKSWGFLKNKVLQDDGGRVRQKVAGEKYIQIMQFFNLKTGPSESLKTTYSPLNESDENKFKPYSRIDYEDSRLDVIKLDLTYDNHFGFSNSQTMDGDIDELAVVEKDYFNQISQKEEKEVQTKKREEKRLNYADAKELFFEILPKYTPEATELALRGLPVNNNYQITVPLILEKPDVDKNFILQSITLKSGEAGGGHYITLKPQVIDGKVAWVCLNDATVGLDAGRLQTYFPTNMLYVESSLLKDEKDKQVYLASKDISKEFNGTLNSLLGNIHYSHIASKTKWAKNR